MKNFLPPLAAALLFSSISIVHASPVVLRCVGETRVTYQSEPCAAGTVSATISKTAEPVKQAVAEPAVKAAVSSAPSGFSRGRLPIHSSRELQPGMLDSEVLNNRRWGRPQQISRSREPGGWHEYWRYEQASAIRQLHFINGVLKAIENLAAENEAKEAADAQDAARDTVAIASMAAGQ